MQGVKIISNQVEKKLVFLTLILCSILTYLTLIKGVKYGIIILMIFFIIYISISFKRYIYTMLLIVPILHILSEMGVGLKSFMIYSIASMVFISISLIYLIIRRNEIRINKKFVVLSIVYIGISFLSIPNSFDPFATLKEIMKLIFFLMFSLSLSQNVVKQNQIDTFIDMMIFSSSGPLIIGLFQLIFKTQETNINNLDLNRINGMFNHSNHYAYYLSIIIISVFIQLLHMKQPKYRKIKVLILLIAFSELIATYSRTAFIFCVLVIMLIVLVNSNIKNKLVMYAIAIVMLICIGQLSGNVESFNQRYKGILDIFSSSYIQMSSQGYYSDSLGWRIYLWRSTLPYIKNHFFVGYGLQNYNYIAQNAIGIFIDAHNNYVKLLLENGVLGLISYFWLIISTLKNCYIKRRQVYYFKIVIFCIIYILFVSLTDPVMTHQVIGFYLWSLMAIGNIDLE